MRGDLALVGVTLLALAGCEPAVPLTRVSEEDARRIDAANAAIDRIEAKRRTNLDGSPPPPRGKPDGLGVTH